MQRAFHATLAAVLLSGLPTIPATAQEPDDRPWSNAADFSVVLTGGNSEATSLSLTDRFSYRWPRSQVTLTVSALRSRTVERGDPELVDGEVIVPERSATAEAYSANGKYRYSLTTALLTYGAGSWERDRRAGIDDRFSGVIGIGYRILETERQSFVAEVGVDYTDENRVDGTGMSYAGVQATLGYERALTETATLTGEVEVLENLEETKDVRVNSTAALTASLSQRLALKLSYLLKFDNRPVTILVDPGTSDQVFVFDKTDTRLGASLVVNF
jgi:putative salt-induced outer membrane protein YdiY